MRKLVVFSILIVVCSIADFSVLKAQTWKEMMDSTSFYFEREDFKTSLKWAKLALPIVEKENGMLDTNYLLVLGKIGELFSFSGNLDSAVQYQEKNLNLCRALFKGDHPKYAESMANLGSILFEYHKLGEAELLLQEALKMMKRIYTGDHYDVAYCMGYLAQLYLDQAKFKDAEPLFKESLDIRKRLFGNDNADVAICKQNLGELYFKMGRFNEAELLLNESLNTLKVKFKEGHPYIIGCLNTLAAIYQEQDRLSNAESLYKESLEMRRKLYDGDHQDIAIGLNNLGILYFNLGRFKEAITLIKESLEMNKRLFKGDHPNLASILNNFGYIYQACGKLEEAETLFKESMEMRKRIYKGDHPSIAESISNLAVLYREQQKFEKAQQLLQAALDMRRRLFNGDHPDIAGSLNNLASILRYLERYNEAETLYKEALEIYRRFYNKNHNKIVLLLENLGYLYQLIGNMKDSEKLSIESLDLIKKIYKNNSTYLSEKEKEQYWNIYCRHYEKFNSFSILRMYDNPAIIGRMFDNQLDIKAQIFNNTYKIKKRILNSGDTILIHKFDDLINIKQELMIYYAMSKSELAAKQIKLDSIESIANIYEKEISLRSEDFKRDYEKNEINWRVIQSAIQQDEAVIELVRFRYVNKIGFFDTVYYAALIVKDTSSVPELVLLNNGNDLEGKYIEEYRNQAGQFKKRVYDPDKVNDKLKELYSQFWAPIQEKLKGIKTVYFSPDGVYNLLNLNTLINPETGKYLLEELDLRLVTSTRDLVGRNQQSPPFSKGGWGVSTAELFGDPKFDLDSTKYELLASNIRSHPTREYYFLGNALDSTTRGAIASLPGTRKEIECIAGSFQKQGWRVNRHLGPEALEEALKAVDNPRVLHIATHGKFLKDVERRNDERMMGFETQRFVENPLLRSMLLFSGAENTLLNQGQQSATQREDGLLTAYEAQNLNLDNTELVVLSACETGLGEIKNGEGVYGLQRAFQVAGAKSLIMSLWSVSDEATQELMSNFYKNWVSGMTKRDAFNKAQQEVRSSYKEPYYWGAFVMVGE